MPSLSAHLRNREAHARLPFHADCPICRDERLLGEVAPHAVVSQRAKASVTAVALAITTAGPAAAFATEPASEWEGATEPTEAGVVDVRAPVAGDDAHVAVFDPGGGSTGLPANADQDDDDDAAPDDPALDDPDASPVVDDDDPDAVDAHDQPAGPPATQPAQPAQSAQPAPPPAPPAQPQRPSAAPATDPARPATRSQQPHPSAARPPNRPAPRAPAARHGRGRARSAQAPRPAPAQPNAAARAATPAPAPRAPTNTSRPTAAANQTDHAGRANHADHGARTHTVRAGESLWSIASDVLGPAAPPLQIAREVHRLWELNKERIATGDPDLLLIDTRLRLR